MASWHTHNRRARPRSRPGFRVVDGEGYRSQFYPFPNAYWRARAAFRAAQTGEANDG